MSIPGMVENKQMHAAQGDKEKEEQQDPQTESPDPGISAP